MKNKKLPLRKAFPLSLAIALGSLAGNSKAQTQQDSASVSSADSLQKSKSKIEQIQTREKQKPSKKPNYIYSKDPKITASGDGIFAKTYLHNFDLMPDSKISFDSLFYAMQGDVNFKFSDAKSGIENILSYMENQGLDSKDTAFRNHVYDLIKYIHKNPSDSLSLEKLNSAVSDNVIDAGEDSLYSQKNKLWEIKDGVYMLVAESQNTKKLEKQSVPMLVELNMHDKKNPKIKVRGLESRLYADNLNDEEKQTKIQYVQTNQDSTQNQKPKKTKQKKLSLIVQGNYGEEIYEAGLGLGVGPVAGLINFARARDENIKDIQTPKSSSGRYFTGTEDNVNYNAVGGSIEAHLWRFYLGAGANYWNYTTNIKESIKANGKTLAENTDSESKNEFSQKAYLGFEFGKNLRLGLHGGYDTKKGGFGGARISYNFRK